MSICKNCGAQLGDGARFCPKCGSLVPTQSQPAYETNPSAQPAYEMNPQTNSQSAYSARPQMQSQPAYNAQPQPQPAYNAQPQPQPAYTAQPAYNAQPYTSASGAASYTAHSAAAEVPAGVKVKGYIGMGLGIESLPMSFIAFICSMMALTIGESDFGFNTMAPPAICFCIFQLAISITAMVLSSSSRNSGFTENATKLGKVFGLIGTIITGISLFFSLIAAA